jgi:hypothetical protein
MKTLAREALVRTFIHVGGSPKRISPLLLIKKLIKIFINTMSLNELFEE